MTLKNERVFKHLLTCTNLTLPQDYEDEDCMDLYRTCVIKSGSIVMLQAYIDINYHHQLIDVTLAMLLIAIDHGDEQFLKHLLQHSILDDEEGEDESEDDLTNLLVRPGVDINILHLISDHLGNHDLWNAITRHSVCHNQAESVQYLLDHMPESITQPKETLFGFISDCCQHGGNDVFKVLFERLKLVNCGEAISIDYIQVSWMVCNGRTQLLKYITDELKDQVNIDLASSKTLLETALIDGHMDMAEHLLELITRSRSHKDQKKRMMVQTVGDINEYKVTTSLLERLSKHQGVKCTINMEQFKKNGMLTNDRALKDMLRSAIRNNSLVAAKHILPHCKNLDITKSDTPKDNIWLRMSPEMGMLIASHSNDHSLKLKPLMLSPKDLENMITAIWSEDSGMNEEVATAFITNNHFDMKQSEELMRAKSLSAGVSLKFMILVNQSKGPADLNRSHLIMAIDHSCVENIIYLKSSGKEPVGVFQEGLIKAIEEGSLAVVQAILDTFTLKDNVEDYLSSASKNTKEVFELVYHKLIGNAGKSIIETLISQAYASLTEYSMDNINVAVLYNSYDVLEYLLDTWTASPFINGITNTQRLRIVLLVLNYAYRCGYTRVIHLCHSIINRVNNDNSSNNKKRKQPEVDESTDTMMETKSTSSSRLSTAFQMVFGDRRLGMIIMRTTGDLYRRFGVKDDKLIKGGQLLAKHTLVDYIKYGAIEWFLKSYYPVAKIYPDNNQLLTAALIRADTQVMDVLLANPSMNIGFQYINDWSILQSIVEHHSHCHQDGLERSIDEMMVLSQKTKFKFEGKLLDTVNHPALMYKLIKLSRDKVYTTKHMIKVMFKHWISDKEAFDRALGPSLLPSHVQPSAQYQVDQSWCIFQMSHVLQALLELCAADGQGVVLNHILERFQDFMHPSVRWYVNYNKIFGCAAVNGHLDIVKQLHQFIISRDRTFDPCRSISEVLKRGHEQVVDFLLGLPLKNDQDMDEEEDDDHDDAILLQEPIQPVRDIHPSILSIGLVQKLVAPPHQFKCSFDRVMARAILNQDKATITFLEEQRDEHQFITNYNLALGAAATIGDVETAEMILQTHQYCIPPEYVDRDFNIYDEDHYSEDGKDLGFEFNIEDETKKSIVLRLERYRVSAIKWSLIEPAVGMVIAKYLASDHINFAFKHLSFVIAASTLPLTKMTDEVVQAFINGWIAGLGKRFEDDDVVKIVKCAASYSLSMIKLVHGIFTSTNHRLLFIRAIPQCAKRGDAQSIQYILDVFRQQETNDDEDTSIDLDDIDYNRLKETTDVDSLAVLADIGIIDSNTHQSRSHLINILDNACNTGHVETIRFIDQRFNNISNTSSSDAGQSIIVVPTIRVIEEAAKMNHHSVITYLFDRSSAFWRSMEQQHNHPLNAIRLLKQLRFNAFNDGHMNIINHCTKLINQLV
ncbi:hypothetical protein SAMD00019534_113810 [Acytostelium subglobosum LB1]|uniref:hypothetical protein n=1 Tax=Acytostelium subglobosum LB1 TaxID=1410327 RepID=UPI0006451B76|nr:hypothetical protein SAMD00019534_113810 [Acytostelium subglobosum LB1]GAM28205.1 hypothetical protein SAMD00019534_113810 [Acytostelium subglobosum LB1]|eukprot:XP_012748839.1 hypothetical protein SAMD00019534_113810 [Acytostelium subglobosum LB1]